MDVSLLKYFWQFCVDKFSLLNLGDLRLAVVTDKVPDAALVKNDRIFL